MRESEADTTVALCTTVNFACCHTLFVTRSDALWLPLRGQNAEWTSSLCIQGNVIAHQPSRLIHPIFSILQIIDKPGH